jgi:hypothetical protein
MPVRRCHREALGVGDEERRAREFGLLSRRVT